MKPRLSEAVRSDYMVAKEGGKRVGVESEADFYLMNS